MTSLSVNINKIALIRNSRGANYPNLLTIAADCEAFGAQGITVHPRPDQRHIRYDDLQPLKDLVTTEFNIEGYPSEEFLQIVTAIKPHQCTLVPDKPGALTSDAGWDTVTHHSFLKETVSRLHEAGIRVSLFIDPIENRIVHAETVGTDRIEFYTGPYAHDYTADRERAIAPFIIAANICDNLGLGINAGHDLNLKNLQYFKEHIPNLLEVSIGHAIVCDALYYGLSNTIQMYRSKLV
ncbi:MAG: pyridoxine 5'-phosphate synthase [Saprospiraceae bacterium]